jgi:CoA:oxalate CoA-transferase
MGPLSGIIVLDLSRVLAGPYCTMVLSDLGARVIKVEKPGTGDDSREIGPFLNGYSAYFTSINHGKESIALDLKTSTDRVIFEALLARADVLVENYRPGVMDKLGYSWDHLHERFPRLIYAAASGFGHTGPYSKRAAYDMVVQGMGGIMSVTGHPGGPPTRVGTSIGDITAGLFTAIGVNAALYERTRTGQGQFIDVGMLDCQIAILENAIMRYVVTGTSPGPLGARHPSIAPFAAFRTQDGHIVIAAGNDELWAKMRAALDLPDDSRFATNLLRCENIDALTHSIESVLTEMPTAVWEEKLNSAGVPCGPINNIAQALADPHIQARHMVAQTAMPDGAPLTIAGNPIKLSNHPDHSGRRKAPVLDEHRAQLLQEFGLSDAGVPD